MTCDASYHIVLRSVDLVDKQPRPPRLLRHYLRGGGGECDEGMLYVCTHGSQQSEEELPYKRGRAGVRGLYTWDAHCNWNGSTFRGREETGQREERGPKRYLLTPL